MWEENYGPSSTQIVHPKVVLLLVGRDGDSAQRRSGIDSSALPMKGATGATPLSGTKIPRIQALAIDKEV